MNKLITAPDNLKKKDCLTLFLAGGISNCPDWQKDAFELIKNDSKFRDITIINPRRYNWDMRADDSESIKQIQWEHKYITDCDYILFWFPKETLCPITLFELGAALRTKDNVFIGVDPEYQRKLDVIEQTRLVRPDIKVYESIPDLISNIEIEKKRKLYMDDIAGSNICISPINFVDYIISVIIDKSLEDMYKDDYNIELRAEFNEEILNNYLKYKSLPSDFPEIDLHFGYKYKSGHFNSSSSGNPILNFLKEYPFVELYIILTPKV